MSNAPHVLESLPAYALDCLDEAEARVVSDHLAGCYICRTELGAFQAVTEQLAVATPDLAAPPELKSRLMKQIGQLQPILSSQPRPQPWLSRWQPTWGIAAALLILALIAVNLLLWQRLTHPAALIGPHGMRAIMLDSTDVAPQASGIIIVGADGQNGVLVVDAMPQLDSERQYQLWLMRDGQNISAAVFSVDESNYRGVRIVAPESLLVYSAAQVTIEPAEGSSEPTGELVMAGLLSKP